MRFFETAWNIIAEESSDAVVKTALRQGEQPAPEPAEGAGTKPEESSGHTEGGPNAGANDAGGEHDKSEEHETTPIGFFSDLLPLFLFLLAVWTAGRIIKATGGPALVGEIIAGCLLGPPLANFAPEHRGIMLVGDMALALLMIEAGLDIDVSLLSQVGPRGLAVALTGTALPLGMGFGFGLAFGFNWRAALAAGCVLQPTSLAIVLGVLKSGGTLNTPSGQVIVAAAAIDDVIAVVLLSELQALEDLKIKDLLIPVVSAVLLLVIVGFFAIAIVPPLLGKVILPRLPPQHTENALLMMIFLLSIGLMSIADKVKSSYLLGALMSGLSFSTVHSVVRCHCSLRAVTFFFRGRTGLPVVPPGRGVEAQTADGLLAFVFCLFFFIFIFFGVVACRMRSLSLAPVLGRPGEKDPEMVRCPCLLPATAFFPSGCALGSLWSEWRMVWERRLLTPCLYFFSVCCPDLFALWCRGMSYLSPGCSRFSLPVPLALRSRLRRSGRARFSEWRPYSRRALPPSCRSASTLPRSSYPTSWSLASLWYVGICSHSLFVQVGECFSPELWGLLLGVPMLTDIVFLCFLFHSSTFSPPWCAFPSLHTQCARGEFAFILALTAKTLKLIDDEQYASLVLPVLLAAVAAPFGLSAAINYSNKKGLENIDEAEDATRYVSLSCPLSVVCALRQHFLQGFFVRHCTARECGVGGMLFGMGRACGLRGRAGQLHGCAVCGSLSGLF